MSSGTAIMIRVTPEDYDHWFAMHDGQKTARLEYGISDGPIYRDESDPTSVLVHLDVEDIERAKGWFQDPRFRGAVKDAGKVKREVYFAQQR